MGMLKNIRGLTLRELEEWIVDIGEKPFRARQIYQWMYQKGIRSFDDMLNLSRKLRETLQQTAHLSSIQVQKKLHSKLDRSVKYLFRLEDGGATEAVYMPTGKRITICLSTMVGCPLGCPYCATGLMGFQRNLNAGEILDQFLIIQGEQQSRITNVVFMGMGEPFLNYDNVMQAAAILNSELGPEIAARRITISTAGLVPEIYRFADEGQPYKLAISLNGTTDRQRDELVPINRKYPLVSLMEAAKYYTRRSGKRVTFEYILIDGVNNSAGDARRLVRLLGQIPCKINVIPYNRNPLLSYFAPSEENLDTFLSHLYKVPFAVTVRRSMGQDIAAACGQLYIQENKQLEI
jgi:23S rRNA (adenine2503-C2)-methyltransferase